jgi:hypothetical protein
MRIEVLRPIALVFSMALIGRMSIGEPVRKTAEQAPCRTSVQGQRAFGNGQSDGLERLPHVLAVIPFRMRSSARKPPGFAG